MNKIDLKHLASHDEDFALWAAEQGALVRAGKLDRIDLENIAEEIESLGNSQKQEIQSRLTVILIHLLKWKFQAGQRTNSWASSIILNRDEIATILERSPSLQNYPATILARAYRAAPKVAALEMGIPSSSLPKSCPFAVEDVLNDEYWPDGAPE